MKKLLNSAFSLFINDKKGNKSPPKPTTPIEIPSELSVVLISRVEGNFCLQVDCEHHKNVPLVWRKAASAMAWVEAGGIVTKADGKPGGHSYKLSLQLPDGSKQPLGEITYFTLSTSDLRQIFDVVCLDPAPGSINGTLVKL